VYHDGWPHLLLHRKPGTALNPGDEILIDLPPNMTTKYKCYIAERLYSQESESARDAARLRELNVHFMQKLQRVSDDRNLALDAADKLRDIMRDGQRGHDKEKASLEETIAKLQSSKSSLEAELTHLRSHQTDRLKQSEKARKQLEAANRDKDKEIKSMQEQHRRQLQEEAQRINKKQEHHRRQLQEERQRSETEIATLRESMGPLEAELISLRESESGHVKEKASLQETIAKLEASKQSLETELTHLRSQQIDNLRALLTSSETEQELSHVVKTLKDKQDELPELHRLIREAESRLEAAHKRAMEQREADRQAAVELQLQQAAREARETINKAREEGREEILKCAICNEEEKRIMLMPCRHLCICRGCCAHIMSLPVAARLCPVCRQNIQRHTEVFLQ